MSNQDLEQLLATLAEQSHAALSKLLADELVKKLKLPEVGANVTSATECEALARAADEIALAAGQAAASLRVRAWVLRASGR